MPTSVSAVMIEFACVLGRNVEGCRRSSRGIWAVRLGGKGAGRGGGRWVAVAGEREVGRAWQCDSDGEGAVSSVRGAGAIAERSGGRQHETEDASRADYWVE